MRSSRKTIPVEFDDFKNEQKIVSPAILSKKDSKREYLTSNEDSHRSKRNNEDNDQQSNSAAVPKKQDMYTTPTKNAKAVSSPVLVRNDDDIKVDLPAILSKKDSKREYLTLNEDSPGSKRKVSFSNNEDNDEQSNSAAVPKKQEKYSTLTKNVKAVSSSVLVRNDDDIKVDDDKLLKETQSTRSHYFEINLDEIDPKGDHRSRDISTNGADDQNYSTPIKSKTPNLKNIKDSKKKSNVHIVTLDTLHPEAFQSVERSLKERIIREVLFGLRTFYAGLLHFLSSLYEFSKQFVHVISKLMKHPSLYRHGVIFVPLGLFFAFICDILPNSPKYNIVIILALIIATGCPYFHEKSIRPHAAIFGLTVTSFGVDFYYYAILSLKTSTRVFLTLTLMTKILSLYHFLLYAKGAAKARKFIDR